MDLVIFIHHGFSNQSIRESFSENKYCLIIIGLKRQLRYKNKRLAHHCYFYVLQIENENAIPAKTFLLYTFMIKLGGHILEIFYRPRTKLLLKVCEKVSYFMTI